MKHSEIEQMIITIIHQKKQMTKTIRTLKRNIRAAKGIQESLAKTLTEAPHFLISPNIGHRRCLQQKSNQHSRHIGRKD